MYTKWPAFAEVCALRVLLVVFDLTATTTSVHGAAHIISTIRLMLLYLKFCEWANTWLEQQCKLDDERMEWTDRRLLTCGLGVLCRGRRRRDEWTVTELGRADGRTGTCYQLQGCRLRVDAGRSDLLASNDSLWRCIIAGTDSLHQWAASYSLSAGVWQWPRLMPAGLLARNDCAFRVSPLAAAAVVGCFCPPLIVCW